MTFVVFAVVCLLPALTFVLFSRAFDWLVRYDGGRRHPWQHRGDRAPRSAEPQTVLADLGADLRRLTGEHEWLLRADIPGRATRLRAVQLAYDDTLLRAAKVLDVDVPDPPLLAVTRLQTEAELTTHGFTW